MLIRFLSSYKAAIILMAIYAILMAIATFVEKESGTTVAKALIYYSPLFIILQALMVFNCIGITIKKKLLSLGKWGYVLVHLAFIIILTGAMTTHLISEEGMLHLREGEKSNVILIKKGDSHIEQHLPFEVELLDFKLTRYPGSKSPSAYESLLKLHIDGKSFEQLVYMNHVLDLKGYRFFQASYDPDELGSILSVSYDVAGRRITYTGYAILFIGLVGCIIGKGSRFRRLSRQLKNLNGVLLLCCLSLASSSAFAIAIPQSHAEKFGNLPMQDPHGRIIPVNTFASQIVRKLHLKETVKGLSEDQIILNLFVEPSVWANKPLILIEEADVRELFTDGKEVISYRDAFNKKGNYRYGADVERAYQKSPAHRSRTDKELLKLDEKINLLHQIFNYQLIRIFPIPNDSIYHHWLAAGDEHSILKEKESVDILRLFNSYRSEVLNAANSGNWSLADKALNDIVIYQESNKSGLVINKRLIDAEVSYNRLNLLPSCRKGYLIMGGILLILSFLDWFKTSEKKWKKFMKITLTTGIIICFICHTYCIGMRGYISGHAPWSNSYETMVFLSWAGVLGGFFFGRRNFTAFALSTLFGGVVLFVSGLNWMDPEITPLVPVLKSPWLMFHVATLMMAYGFLGIGCMIATTNLIAASFMTDKNSEMISKRILSLSIVSELALIIGLALMTVGIFLGAVWANESWGRYWSWDPKETWALITAVIYAIVLHLRWFEKQTNTLRFNLLTQWAFLAVLMTYFGVNYLLSGMHSYGNTSGLAGLPIWVYAAIILFFICPGCVAYLRNAQLKK